MARCIPQEDAAEALGDAPILAGDMGCAKVVSTPTLDTVRILVDQGEELCSLSLG